MSIFFTGGAIGSSLSGYLYAKGGWGYIVITGLIVSILVFIYYIGEYFGNLSSKLTYQVKDKINKSSYGGKIP